MAANSIADFFAPFKSGAFVTGAGTRNAPTYNIDLNQIRGRSGAEWSSGNAETGFQGGTDPGFTIKGADGSDLYVELDHEGNYVVRPNMDMGGQFWGKEQSKLNGAGWDKYSPDMKFLNGGDYSGIQDSTAAPWMGAAMMTAGIGASLAGLGAAGAGAAGAAGGAFGGASAADIGMMYAGADAAAAGSLGMGGMTGAEVMAGAGGLTGAAGGGVFNAAMDSQLANSLIESGAFPHLGTDALAGYTAAGIPSVTISNLASNPTLWDKLKDLAPSSLKSLGDAIPGGLGSLATLAGGLLGSQGESADASSTRQLPDFLKGPVTQDLIPRTQGLLASQMPQAQQAGASMMQQGQGLLSAPVAGNGVGKVSLNSPTTATNPYLSGMADDIGRRTQEMLGQNNLAIQGNAVGVGGLGGSRQGVAQGIAAGKSADYLQGNLSNLYGQAYNSDQNRALQQYGMDQSFYGNQRGQDLSQVGLGSGLVSQGLQTQWSPIQNATQAYSPFTGFGTTTNNQSSGGGWQGALGGALGAAQLSKNMGWW